MITNLMGEGSNAVISDSTSDDIQEQPIIAQDCTGSGGVTLSDVHGNEIYFPYRMWPEIKKAVNKICQGK